MRQNRRGKWSTIKQDFGEIVAVIFIISTDKVFEIDNITLQYQAQIMKRKLNRLLIERGVLKESQCR